MKSIYLTILLILVSSSIAVSQSSIDLGTKAEKIDQFVSLLGSEEQFENFVNSGMDMIIEKYKNNLSEQDKKILLEESVNMVKKFLENDLRRIYDKYLTEKELDDLIDFYSSETGRRFRLIQPSLTAEIQKVMVEKYTEEFTEIITERLSSN